jgi:hypothetical protein
MHFYWAWCYLEMRVPEFGTRPPHVKTLGFTKFLRASKSYFRRRARGDFALPGRAAQWLLFPGDRPRPDALSVDTLEQFLQKDELGGTTSLVAGLLLPTAIRRESVS